jgi:hypothetical protein
MYMRPRAPSLLTTTQHRSWAVGGSCTTQQQEAPHCLLLLSRVSRAHTAEQQQEPLAPLTGAGSHWKAQAFTPPAQQRCSCAAASHGGSPSQCAMEPHRLIERGRKGSGWHKGHTQPQLQPPMWACRWSGVCAPATPYHKTPRHALAGEWSPRRKEGLALNPPRESSHAAACDTANSYTQTQAHKKHTPHGVRICCYDMCWEVCSTLPRHARPLAHWALPTGPPTCALPCSAASSWWSTTADQRLLLSVAADQGGVHCANLC